MATPAPEHQSATDIRPGVQGCERLPDSNLDRSLDQAGALVKLIVEFLVDGVGGEDPVSS